LINIGIVTEFRLFTLPNLFSIRMKAPNHTRIKNITALNSNALNPAL